jgi:hypothetical protein
MFETMNGNELMAIMLLELEKARTKDPLKKYMYPKCNNPNRKPSATILILNSTVKLRRQITI